MARFLELIKDREAKLRDRYAETLHNLQSDEFVTMVLVDAVFVIELFLRCYKPDLITDDDRIFRKSRLLNEIQYDLFMMENQLPLFIFSDLFNLAKTATSETGFYGEINFTTIACYWFGDDYLPIGENLLKNQFSRAEHFVDLIILCLHPSQRSAKIGVKDLHIPSVQELHQAGVKFKPGSSKNLLDIKFNQGILEIPFLTMYDYTECLYRNLLVFENMHGYTGYFNDYIIMMCCLVKAPKDAELLIQNEIIGLGDSEFLPTVFSNNLDKDCTMHESDFQYSVVVGNLQAYRKLRWHKWQANLKQNYFNTPWAFISVFAASILLLLTLTQTVCSLIGL